MSLKNSSYITIITYIIIGLSLFCSCSKKMQKSGILTEKANIIKQSKEKEAPKNRDQTVQLSKNKAVKDKNNGQSLLDESLDFCQTAQEYWQHGELEEAIKSLDSAYSLIIKVNTGKDPKLEQQKEDIRFMISKRLLEIYASRNIVVNGNHKAIPLVMNDHVRREIKNFTSKGIEGKFFISSYKRSGKYRKRIIESLKEAGLPVELSWLPLIESGFKSNALSRARALGLWQFIPSTGYKFGLKRDRYIDERLDPLKSTEAAIMYLKELHRIFGDWATVLAAYNCGEGRVLKVIRSQNINYLDNFWDLYEQLPRETARYVPKFMATLHIIKNPSKYKIDKVKLDPLLEFETVSVNRRSLLKNIAAAIGVTEKKLKELNPELRYRLLPEEEYELRVPPEKGKILLSKLNSIPISARPTPAYVYHRVRNGETISTIAMHYRTSVKRIMRANNLRKRNFILAGTKLKIPRKGTIIPISQKPKKIVKLPSVHKVKTGDSLWIIAKKYGTTTKKIQKRNNMKTTRLRIGQRLKIPGKDYLENASDQFKIYTVRKGDTPYQIAINYNIPLKRFLIINRLTRKTKIYPGQNLYID